MPKNITVHPLLLTLKIHRTNISHIHTSTMIYYLSWIKSFNHMHTPWNTLTLHHLEHTYKYYDIQLQKHLMQAPSRTYIQILWYTTTKTSHAGAISNIHTNIMIYNYKIISCRRHELLTLEVHPSNISHTDLTSGQVAGDVNHVAGGGRVEVVNNSDVRNCVKLSEQVSSICVCLCLCVWVSCIPRCWVGLIM